MTSEYQCYQTSQPCLISNKQYKIKIKCQEGFIKSIKLVHSHFDEHTDVEFVILSGCFQVQKQSESEMSDLPKCVSGVNQPKCVRGVR